MLFFSSQGLNYKKPPSLHKTAAGAIVLQAVRVRKPETVKSNLTDLKVGKFNLKTSVKRMNYVALELSLY